MDNGRLADTVTHHGRADIVWARYIEFAAANPRGIEGWLFLLADPRDNLAE